MKKQISNYTCHGTCYCDYTHWALDLKWLWFGNLTHSYKLVTICTCKTPPFSLIRPWLLMEYTTIQYSLMGKIGTLHKRLNLAIHNEKLCPRKPQHFATMLQLSHGYIFFSWGYAIHIIMFSLLKLFIGFSKFCLTTLFHV